MSNTYVTLRYVKILAERACKQVLPERSGTEPPKVVLETYT